MGQVSFHAFTECEFDYTKGLRMLYGCQKSYHWIFGTQKSRESTIWVGLHDKSLDSPMNIYNQRMNIRK